MDLENDNLEDVGGVHLVFDVIGGETQKRSAAVIRAGGTLVTITGPAEARPADGLAIDFVVESDRAQLGEIVQRVRDGRLRTNIGKVATLDDASPPSTRPQRRNGKTIIQVALDPKNSTATVLSKWHRRAGPGRLLTRMEHKSTIVVDQPRGAAAAVGGQRR